MCEDERGCSLGTQDETLGWLSGELVGEEREFGFECVECCLGMGLMGKSCSLLGSCLPHSSHRGSSCLGNLRHCKATLVAVADQINSAGFEGHHAQPYPRHLLCFVI